MYVAEAAFDYMTDQVRDCDWLSTDEKLKILSWMNNGELLTDMVRSMKSVIERQNPSLLIKRKESE